MHALVPGKWVNNVISAGSSTGRWSEQAKLAEKWKVEVGAIRHSILPFLRDARLLWVFDLPANETSPICRGFVALRPITNLFVATWLWLNPSVPAF